MVPYIVPFSESEQFVYNRVNNSNADPSNCDTITVKPKTAIKAGIGIKFNGKISLRAGVIAKRTAEKRTNYEGKVRWDQSFTVDLMPYAGVEVPLTKKIDLGFDITLNKQTPVEFSLSYTAKF